MKARSCRRSPWVYLGVGVGAAMGSATGAMGVWVALGAAIGLALQVASGGRP